MHLIMEREGGREGGEKKGCERWAGGKKERKKRRRAGQRREDKMDKSAGTGTYLDVRASKHSTVCSARFLSSRPPITYILPCSRWRVGERG